jgi:hypothetical protein
VGLVWALFGKSGWAIFCFPFPFVKVGSIKAGYRLAGPGPNLS